MSNPTPRTPFASLGGLVTDLAGVAGAVLITFGVAQIYRPAAFIVAGAFLLIGAWLAARKGDA